jgi:hypothetical protein
MHVDITPKYALLDLRVESGMHVIASSVATEHIWFLFPPTVSHPSYLFLCFLE